MTNVQSSAKMIHFIMKRKRFQDLIGMWEDSFASDPDGNHDHMKVEIKRALYSPIWLVLFSTSLLILLFTGFVTVAVSLNKIQYILLTAYVIGNSIQLYLLCQCGDRLKQESCVLSEDGFSSAWYQCPKDIRTSMKIIFQRAQVHLELSAFGVVPLSSETFQWVGRGVLCHSNDVTYL
uniref:Uncharacterized protein n=1 Tax=Timema shepardi TaxID=629360 RepID=A0A7R9B0X5_TIMSH|nr:unnamed protein product [Timema shepardi]